ncbi:Protein of unknown function [Gryllus bimaculatus]|nr:Protein of unknown function [Gryllus bimaculatus]
MAGGCLHIINNNNNNNNYYYYYYYYYLLVGMCLWLRRGSAGGRAWTRGDWARPTHWLALGSHTQTHTHTARRRRRCVGVSAWVVACRGGARFQRKKALHWLAGAGAGQALIILPPPALRPSLPLPAAAAVGACRAGGLRDLVCLHVAQHSLPLTRSMSERSARRGARGRAGLGWDGLRAEAAAVPSRMDFAAAAVAFGLRPCMRGLVTSSCLLSCRQRDFLPGRNWGRTEFVTLLLNLSQLVVTVRRSTCPPLPLAVEILSAWA